MKRNISSLVRKRLIDLAILARQGRAVVKKKQASDGGECFSDAVEYFRQIHLMIYSSRIGKLSARKRLIGGDG